MSRILFLSNIPTPYQNDFLTEINSCVAFKAIFLSKVESNRDWNINFPVWAEILPEDERWKNLNLILTSFKPTHIIIGGYFLPLSFRLLLWCRLNKVHVSYWLEPPLPSGFFKKLIKFIWFKFTISRANLVLAIGSNAINAYRLFNKNIVNLPYSINVDRYVVGVRENSKVKFLYLGQYIERKGILPLLDAAMMLDQNSFILDLVGSGPLKDRVIASQSINSSIRQKDFVEPNQLPQLIKDYDVLIAPSFHDGWAVVIAEALASGLPVISTPYAGAAVDLILPSGENKNGVIIEPSASEIYMAMQDYINKKYDLDFESFNAFTKVRSSLGSSKNAAKFLIDMLAAIDG